MTIPSFPSIRRRTAVVPVVLLSATLGLTACGGGSSDTSSNAAASTATTTGQPRSAQAKAAREKLQACLKQQGAALPEPPAGGARPDGADAPPPGNGQGQPQGRLPGTGGGNGRPNGNSQGGARRGGPMANLSAAERKKLQAAFKKCGGTMRFGGGAGPGGRPGGGGGTGQRPNVNDASYRKRITAYVTCVRKHGFDLPDPNFSGKGPVFDAKKVNQSDPKFVKASTACQSKLRP